MNKIFSMIYVSSVKLNNCLRYFHGTVALKIKTRIKVNEYLFNRTIPATEILNNLDEEDAKRLEEIKHQHRILLTDGELVPTYLKDNDLLELLCLSSSQRLNYFRYLAKNEFNKEKNRTKRPENISNTKIIPEDYNTYIGKFFNKINKNLMNKRLINAILMKSQELVFDFSFENDMTRREVKECAKQFKECFGLNRRLADPYQMGIINFQAGSLTHSDMKQILLSAEISKYNDIEDLPLVFHKKPLIETYPDRKIIYLTPNSMKTFEEGEYDHDAVYIIGLIVDKGEQQPLSLAKARKEGLEHRSLPLERNVKWVIGDKSLPLNHMFNIMSIARETNGDWCKAIRQSLPSRVISPRNSKNQRKF